MAFSEVLPAAHAQEPPAGGADAVPVRLKASCRPPQPAARRPRSAFRRGTGSVIDRIASALPGSRGLAVLARVADKDEALTCYRAGSAPPGSQASTAWDRSVGDLEVVLRMPLRLALVASVGDAAISITMPSEDALGRLRGVGRPRCDFFSALRGTAQRDQPAALQSVTLECQSEEAARFLMGRLQQAGCILQGLRRRYAMLDQMGSGTFGVVFRAEDLYTGHHVAVKVFTELREDKVTHPFREASILQACNHPNVQGFCGLYEVTEIELLDSLGIGAPCTYAIVSEILEGGDLLTHMQRRTRISESHVRDLAKQLLSAVSHLHDRSIVHRDLKPENMILTASGDVIKLIDFGLSALEQDSEAMCMKVGSPGYVAPEMVAERTTCKADCFSVGATLFALLTGQALFAGRDAAEKLANNLRGQASMRALQQVSAAAREVVLGLLRSSPRERLSAAEALSQPWFGPQPVRPIAPARRPSPRTGKALPRARHLPTLRAFRLLYGPEVPSEVPAVELDLGAQGLHLGLPRMVDRDASAARPAARLPTPPARRRARSPTPPGGAGPACSWSRRFSLDGNLRPAPRAALVQHR